MTFSAGYLLQCMRATLKVCPDPRSTTGNEPGKTPAFWGAMNRLSYSITKDLLTSSLWFEKASLVLVVSGRTHKLLGTAMGGFSRQEPLTGGCPTLTL